MNQKANTKRFIIFLLTAVVAFFVCTVASAEEESNKVSYDRTNASFSQADDKEVFTDNKKSDVKQIASTDYIYPGEEETQGGKSVWVAYDAKYNSNQPENATVKATVILPNDVKVPNGYKLFIRRINTEEEFYPSAEEVKKKVSEYNGYQCYMIRWVKVDTLSGDPVVPVETLSMYDILGNNDSQNVSIKIEYLKDEARLSGPVGARKLLVFNSERDGKIMDTVSDSVTDVNVTDTHYRNFTFNTHQTGPYVFVSKKLPKGYIEKLVIEEIIDGFAPFDGKDEPGYDSAKNNKIVRSYDTIQYLLGANIRGRQITSTEKSINVYFELSLMKSATAARFDTTKMNWLGDNYSVEYLDAEGDVVMIQTHKGEFREPEYVGGNVVRDEHGFAKPGSKKVSFNAQLNGSKNGSDSYKVSTGGIVEQKLTGWITLTANEGDNILSGTQEFKAAVEVRNADNGEIFQPTFKMWVEGNEDNYGGEGGQGDEMVPAKLCEDNIVSAEKHNIDPVTVSAGTNFNIQLDKNTDMSYKNWFDFATGKEVKAEIQAELDELANIEANYGKSNPAEFVTAEGTELSSEKKDEYKNYRYGRITCYGITLQLYNDTDVEPIGDNRASKRLKGLSLPVGDIEFDLNFSSIVDSNNKPFEGSDKEYTAILWDYNENVPANNSFSYTYLDPDPSKPDGIRGTVRTPNDGKGNGGRNLYWDGEERSPYAKGAAPGNIRGYFDGCYYGGDWALMNGDAKVNSLEELSKIAHPEKVKGTGEGYTYHFSVSDYDFDFDTHHFPLRNSGNSGNVPAYDTYARCFSAGCVQVLSVFPRVQKQSPVNIHLKTTVNNLTLRTRANQPLKPLDGDFTGIEHEVNKKDNERRDEIVVYAPGHLTKGSSFNGRHNGREPMSTSEGFLGTDYWTTSYDCSTFAGDDIWLMSYGMMQSGSDYHMKSMNLLQIFDSRALSIRGEPKVYQNKTPENKEGDVKFLYAADPDYPYGYDTNREGDPDMVEYMNTVREEDLVYSENGPDANGDITVNGNKLKCIGVLMEIRNCDLLGGKYQYLSIPIKVNGEEEELIGKTVATVNSFRTWSYNVGSEITWSKGHWDEEKGKNVLDKYPTPGKEPNLSTYSGELCNQGDLIYTKTEYKDGQKVPNSHGGGTLAGNSLLILGYKAHINLGVDGKNSESGSYIYNQDNNETIVEYRLRNIKTEISDYTGQENPPKTTLTVRAVLDVENDTGMDRISIAGDTYKMGDKEISSDSANPTSITFTDPDGKEYTIKVYAKREMTGHEVSFVIADVPVGVELPDITFQANFGSIKNLTDNAAIKTNAYISGTGDNRAYNKTNGNMDNVTVNVVLRGGTYLSKDVTEKYIEQNGMINYDITYTNSGSTEIEKLYFYDLFPAENDIRDSKFDGDVILRSFGGHSNGDLSDAIKATVYYSTTKYEELYNEVSKFGGEVGSEVADEAAKAEAVEELLSGKSDSSKNPFFNVLGTIENNKFKRDPNLPTDLDGLMKKITGLYVKAEHLKNNQTITLKFGIETRENNAGNLYRNISNSWIAGKATLPLKSTRVETAVVSRSISGVVWYDWNLNGIRDEGVEKEKPIKDAEVTLFIKNKSGMYEICREDITGQPINIVKTGEDGSYSFDKLAQGDYIVAFSGETLKSYTDATFYQQNGKNDSNTSDGKTSDELASKGIDKNIYPYFIKYSADAENMTLHSIDDIRNGSVELNNYKEDISHQDLGVIVAGYELPKTGGRGSLPYTAGGILLVMAAFLVYGFTVRHRQCRQDRTERG